MSNFERYKLAYLKMSNFKKNIKFSIDNREETKKRKNILKTNIVFKNCHEGERVFILANGPSIKNEKLDFLKGEYVFTVNQMIRKPYFVELEPLANFWFDPAYFDEKMPETSKNEFINLFKKTCNCNEKIINFVPLDSFDFLKKNELVDNRVHFIDTSLFFYDGYDKEFDFTKCCPSFQNIVQFAIAMAVYMGFKKIYLLGVDSTGIITKINSVLDRDIEDCYGIDLGESGQKYVNSLLDYFSVEQQFEGWTRIFHLYKELFRYCEHRGIELLNCSSQTIIEGIPRTKLESVFK